MTPGERFTIRTSIAQTGGIYTMLEIIADPRNGVPMHVHAHEEEHFVILEGSLHLMMGDRQRELGAGDTATVLRGTPHAWANLSDGIVRMLIIFSPGQIEETFRLIGTMQGKDFSAIAASNEAGGSMIVGPSPFAGIHSIMSPRPSA
ncbi:cupin domain-containing protein [Roseomonas sp. F4]